MPGTVEASVPFKGLVSRRPGFESLAVNHIFTNDVIESFHSLDQRPNWFTETKENVCRKCLFPRELVWYTNMAAFSFITTTTTTRHFICQLEKIYKEEHKLKTIWQKNYSE